MNWNSPAFWSGINEGGSGHTLDFSALSGAYTVSVEVVGGTITRFDGSTTFTVGQAGYGGTADVLLGGTTLLSYFENLDGSDGDDTLRGGGAEDAFSGGLGDDSVVGNAGSDTLDGGSGNDSLVGGGGDDALHGNNDTDTLEGGAGDDQFSYSVGDGHDTISDFNTGISGTLTDGDNTNNDFIDLSGFNDNLSELRADQNDDGIGPNKRVAF